MSFTRFLDLPREIRDQIYVSHFRTTTLTYPTFTLPPLLFTSRQIYREALPFLRPNASHNLLTSEHLLDYLTTLTPAFLAQLRHIAVRGVPIPIYPLNDDLCYHTHLFPDLLTLFPGLQLDTLEVIDAYHGADVAEDGFGHGVTYYDLEGLIKEGKGWKELIYTSASDRWLESVTFTHRAADGTVTTETKTRDKQPGVWDRMIKQRDGEESGAGVEMWLCKERGAWEKVEGDYNTGMEEELSQGDDEDDEDVVRARPSIMFRVTRGTGSEYVQDGSVVDESEFHRGLRETFETISWKEIKARNMFIPGAEDDPTAHL